MEGASSKGSQHVRVYVRVRPLNLCEKKGRNVAIVECSGTKTVKIKDRSHTGKAKSFNFDKVFCSESKQVHVYQSILSPMIDEVLSGYNCTVFAYGQTGSGKTFTMVGERSADPNISWDVDPLCGLIPRALSHLFDKLVNVQENYAVRVSYLELYNEELIDLLSKTDDVPKLKLYEDSARKGGIIVQGLEELEVNTKDEIYHILEKGSLKRQVAATLMNSQSSRSHTVFTITVHIKETLSKEEVVKTGRLNLVDLAGSENIGRSGSVDKRAREAGNINQSLLTLGRVITALTENAPHIPYRESKLTRLLQESLGGCTKTSIIATVSPAASNIEETLSTLEYAFRARKITNRPEINQKHTRKALIREYTEEIERLRRDLLCNREKSGVYLGYDDYVLMLTNLEQLQEENERKLATIAALNEEMKATEELCNKLSMKIERKSDKQHEVSKCLSEVTAECSEKSHLLKVHMESEKQLVDQTRLLQSVASESSSHIYKLHDKLSQVASVDSENVERREHFKNDALRKMKNTEDCLAEILQKCSVMHTMLKAVFTDHPEKRLQDYKSVEETASSCLKRLDQTLRSYRNDNSESVTKTGEAGQQIVVSVREFTNSICQRWRHYLEYADLACKQVEDDVSALQNESEVFRNIERQEYLEQMQKIVEEYDMIQKCMEEYRELELQERLQMQKSLEDMLQHQVQFNDDLESLDNYLKRMAESVATRVHQHEEFTPDNPRLDALKNKIVRMFDHQADAYRKLRDACREDCEKVSSHVDTAVANCTSRLTSVAHHLSNVEAATSDIVESNEASWNECALVGKEEISSLGEQFGASNRKSVQHAEMMNNIVKEMVSDSDLVLSRQQTDIVEMVEACESLASQENCVRECGVGVLKDIDQWEKDVEEFVTSGLCKELRTGKTPERKEFKYPREIASSSPDDCILERFRSSESYKCSDADMQVHDKENTDIACVATAMHKNVNRTPKKITNRILEPRN